MVKQLLCQLGDEGKGKITDMLAEKAWYYRKISEVVNAGHTIINNYGNLLFILAVRYVYDHTSVISNSVALNIPVFFKEYNMV